MRRENLPDWAHDKVIWKRGRDLLTMHRNNVTLDVVEKYHSDVIECFIWGLQET